MTDRHDIFVELDTIWADCSVKCKSNGDICLNKGIMDVARDTWKSTIM